MKLDLVDKVPRRTEWEQSASRSLKIQTATARLDWFRCRVTQNQEQPLKTFKTCIHESIKNGCNYYRDVRHVFSFRIELQSMSQEISGACKLLSLRQLFIAHPIIKLHHSKYRQQKPLRKTLFGCHRNATLPEREKLLKSCTDELLSLCICAVTSRSLSPRETFAVTLP